MTLTTAFSTDIDWSNFNSSVVIEVTRPSGKFTCSGVAISPQIILTAAHCLDGDIKEVKVFNEATYHPSLNHFEVANFELHPEYDKNKSNYQADIARIQLKDKLPESTNFFPIIKKTTNINGQFIRLGFGERNQANTRTMITPLLKQVNPLQNVLELNDMYSYSGDSGGPIFMQQDGQMYLVAIHSTLSYGPEGKYSYNPLIASSTSWIFDH